MTDIFKTIETKDLVIGYKKSKGTNILLSKINLSASRGELIALIGMNGSGKSTLLRTIGNFQNPLSGEILVLNNQIQTYSPEKLARKISFVSTERTNLNNISVREIIELGRYPYTGIFGKLTNQDHVIIEEVITQLNLKNISDKNLFEISDGEKQRVMIARALAQDTEIIILDEPTAFLDIPNRFETVQILKSLAAQKNKTILFSTHDLPIAMQSADKIWLISNGSISEGAPEDLVINNNFEKLFSSEKLVFDDIKGDYVYSEKLHANINLKGSGRIFEWTKKALNRNYFNITSNNDADINVSIKDNEQEINWEIEKENSKFVVTSIYNLILFLKNQ